MKIIKLTSAPFPYPGCPPDPCDFEIMRLPIGSDGRILSADDFFAKVWPSLLLVYPLSCDTGLHSVAQVFRRCDTGLHYYWCPSRCDTGLRGVTQAFTITSLAFTITSVSFTQGLMPSRYLKTFIATVCQYNTI